MLVATRGMLSRRNPRSDGSLRFETSESRYAMVRALASIVHPVRSGTSASSLWITPRPNADLPKAAFLGDFGFPASKAFRQTTSPLPKPGHPMGLFISLKSARSADGCSSASYHSRMRGLSPEFLAGSSPKETFGRPAPSSTRAN